MKEEVEAHIVEEKVEVTGMMRLRTFSGGRTADAFIYMPWDAAVL